MPGASRMRRFLRRHLRDQHLGDVLRQRQAGAELVMVGNDQL